MAESNLLMRSEPSPFVIIQMWSPTAKRYKQIIKISFRMIIKIPISNCCRKCFKFLIWLQSFYLIRYLTVISKSMKILSFLLVFFFFLWRQRIKLTWNLGYLTIISKSILILSFLLLFFLKKNLDKHLNQLEITLF